MLENVPVARLRGRLGFGSLYDVPCPPLAAPQHKSLVAARSAGLTLPSLVLRNLLFQQVVIGGARILPRAALRLHRRPAPRRHNLPLRPAPYPRLGSRSGLLYHRALLSLPARLDPGSGLRAWLYARSGLRRRLRRRLRSRARLPRLNPGLPRIDHPLARLRLGPLGIHRLLTLPSLDPLRSLAAGLRVHDNDAGAGPGDSLLKV